MTVGKDDYNPNACRTTSETAAKSDAVSVRMMICPFCIMMNS